MFTTRWLKKTKRITYIYIVIYFLFNLLCFFQYLSLDKEALLITALLVGFGFFFPYTEMGVYLFACLPFFNVMNFQVGTTSMYYVLTGIAVLRYSYQEHNYKLKKKMVLLCIIVIATCYNLEAVKEYIRWIIRIIPLVFFFREDVIKKHLKNIIDRYTLSMLFSSLWGWLMLKAGSSIYNGSHVYNEGTYVIRFAGLVGDSVVYGIQLLLLISFIMVLIFRESEWRKTRLTAVILLYCFGLITFSKTFLFFMVLQIFYIYIYWSHRKKWTGKSIMLNAVVFIGMLTTTAWFVRFLMTSNNDWASTMRIRLLSVDMSTGRLDVWRYYLGWCMDNWISLFRGMGFSEYFTLRPFRSVSGYYYLINRAHNLYIETIVVFGVLESLVVFGALIIWTIKSYRKQRNTLYFLPLMTLLITGMTTHGHFEYSFYLNVLLIISIAENGRAFAASSNTLEIVNSLMEKKSC